MTEKNPLVRILELESALSVLEVKILTLSSVHRPQPSVKAKLEQYKASKREMQAMIAELKGGK